MNMKTKLIALTIIMLTTLSVWAAYDVFDEVGSAIRSGDSKSISKYFGSTIDLTINSQEEVYSKAQAELILKDFFSKNNPKTFTIIHKGDSKEGASYAIGSLVTSQGNNYRIYFYVKQQGGATIIQELRLMKE